MRTLSIDLDHAVTADERAEDQGDLSWLGDLSPDLTAKKSARFLVQATIGIAVIAGFLALL